MQLCLSTEYKTRDGLRMLCAYQVTAVFPPSGKQGGRTVACLNILAAFISFGLLPNGEQYGYCFFTFPTSSFQEVVHNALLPEFMSTYVSYRHKVSVLHSLLLMRVHKTQLFPTFGLYIICFVFSHSLTVNEWALGPLGTETCCTGTPGVAQQAPSDTGTFSVRLLAPWVTLATTPVTCSSSCCQFLAVLCAASLLPVVAGRKSGCNVARGVFWSWEFLGYCSLGYFLSAAYCMRATDI